MTHPSTLRALARRAIGMAEMMEIWEKRLLEALEEQDSPDIMLSRHFVGTMRQQMEEMVAGVRKFSN